MTTKRIIIFLLLITILGAFLRIYRLDAQSFWTDEFRSIKDSSIRTSQIFYRNEHIPSALDKSIWYNFHGPLYYILLHFWAKWGETVFNIRLLSALIGIATIPFIYLLGRKIVDTHTGVISAYLLAISPFHIWYSQEARMYVLVMALVTVSVYCFFQLLEKPTPKWAFLYSMTTILSIFSFPSALFVVLAENIFLIFHRKKYKTMFKQWVSVQLIVAIFVIIFFFQNFHFLTYLSSPQFKIGSAKAVNYGSLLNRIGQMGYTFFTFSVGFSVGPSVAELHYSPSIRHYFPYIYILLPIFSIFLSLFFLGLKKINRDKEKIIFLLLFLLLPILIVFFIGYLKGTALNVRYVSPSLIGYILIIGVGINFRKSKGWRIMTTSLVTLCCLYALNNYFFNPKYAKEDYRSAAKYIELHSGPVDIIAGFSLPHFKYYYSGNLPLLGLSSWGTSHSLFAEKFVKKIENIEGYERLWFVSKRLWVTDPGRLATRYLDREFKVIEHRKFPGVELYCYQIN